MTEKQTRSEVAQGHFTYLADEIGAYILSEFPTPMTHRSVISMRCGCDERYEFTADIPKLTRMGQVAHDKGVKVYCEACRSVQARKKVEDIAAIYGATARVSGDTVNVTCSNGHESDVLRGNFKRGWTCPECPKTSRGEQRLRELAAERGYHLKRYDTRGLSHGFISPDGESCSYSSSNFKHALGVEPDGPQGKGYNLNAYWNGLRVFYCVGALPRLLPATLWEHVAASQHAVTSIYTRVSDGYRALKDVVEKPSPAQVLNVSGQWISPGVYTWGTFPIFYNTLEEQP